MDTIKQKLTLQENLAAVRFSPAKEDEIGDEATGVAVVIPAGETVRTDRTAQLVGHMRLIEWKGSSYGVFPEDLLERAEKASQTKTA